ncbi:hypothetical protein FLBR109950_03115 [Flavobacterium branchiophilum]
MTMKMDFNKIIKLLLLGLFVLVLLYNLGKQCAIYDLKHKATSEVFKL